MKILHRNFHQFHHPFWLDYILHQYTDSIHGMYGFTENSIKNSLNTFCQETKGAYYFEANFINVYLAKLLADEYIIATNPLERSYKITHKGLAFLLIDDGYLALAKKTRKERLRFDFEYFKVGYDTVASTIAIIISIIALYVSLKQ